VAKFPKNPKKSRVQALKLDTNLQRYLNNCFWHIPSLPPKKMPKLGGGGKKFSPGGMRIFVFIVLDRKNV